MQATTQKREEVGSWMPILDGTLYTRAEDALGRIVTLSRAFDAKKLSDLPTSTLCGSALMTAYLGVARSDDVLCESSVEQINVALSKSGDLRHYGASGGLSELAWTIQHISRLEEAGDAANIPDAMTEFGEELDSELIKALLDDKARLISYDFSTGLTGLGVYFLERMPAESARAGLESIISLLSATAEETEAGITWRSTPTVFVNSGMDFKTDSVYCLGLAEGVAGLIQLLGELRTFAVRPEECERLAEGVISWLMAQPAPVRGVMRFGPWIVNGRAPRTSRLGWCHGDLGILSALLQVAGRFDRHDWRTHADILLSRCLTLPSDAVGVSDLWLCHGSAGIGHMFNRIYQTTGDARCREAAIAWFDWTLSPRNPYSLPHLLASVSGGSELSTTPSLAVGSLRQGISGVALALLAATTSVKPQWDRLLLLSGRSAAANSWEAS